MEPEENTREPSRDFCLCSPSVRFLEVQPFGVHHLKTRERNPYSLWGSYSTGSKHSSAGREDRRPKAALGAPGSWPSPSARARSVPLHPSGTAATSPCPLEAAGSPGQPPAPSGPPVLPSATAPAASDARILINGYGQIVSLMAFVLMCLKIIRLLLSDVSTPSPLTRPRTAPCRPRCYGSR